MGSSSRRHRRKERGGKLRLDREGRTAAMGIYSEYLDSKRIDLIGERKRQLQRIQSIRGRDLLVFATDLKKNGPYIPIGYPDLLPITDQLTNLVSCP